MENSRILLLTGAIMSIVLGAIVLSMGIIILSAMVDIGNINAQSTNFLVCNIGEILLGAVLIVMGILLCLNPDKRNNKDGPFDTYEKLSGSKTLGFCGAILGSSLILIINFILNFFSVFLIIPLTLCVALVVIMIVSIFLYRSSFYSHTSVYIETGTANEVSTTVVNSGAPKSTNFVGRESQTTAQPGKKRSNLNNNIEQICELNRQGVLTDEETKELIFRQLEK